MKKLIVALVVLSLVLQGLLFIGESILYNQINKPAPAAPQQYQIKPIDKTSNPPLKI
jgi:hypothetical protein